MPRQFEELSIQQAIEEVKNGSKMRAAARKFGIAESTLRDRLRGARPRSLAHQDLQMLSPMLEDLLVQWILSEDACGRAPRRAKLQAFARHLAGLNTRLHRSWYDGFIQRHPECGTKKTRLLEKPRYNLTREEVEKWYEKLDRVVRDYKVLPSNMANLDEHGIAEGSMREHYVVASTLTRRSTLKSSSARDWVSILQCCIATGKHLSPLILFKGAALQGQWFDEIRDSYRYDVTPNGWSTTETFLKWFCDIYLPETKPAQGQWRLLIMDNHETHEDVKTMRLAAKNKVLFFFLPAHSSHVL